MVQMPKFQRALVTTPLVPKMHTLNAMFDADPCFVSMTNSHENQTPARSETDSIQNKTSWSSGLCARSNCIVGLLHDNCHKGPASMKRAARNNTA